MIKTIYAFLFLLLCSFAHYTKALVLENLINNNTLSQTLSNKKICYFSGSFDPIHLGHQDIAKIALKEHLCDFVLPYPSWGKDTYKNRVDIKFRIQMLYSIFEDHPQFIVTSLPPQEIQKILTKDSFIKHDNKNSFVEPAFEGMEFIGLIGADTALYLYNNDDALKTFMTGIKVPKEYYDHTLGCLMAIPVKSFILALRSDYDTSKLTMIIGNRPIIGIIKSEQYESLSSSKVKIAIKNNNSLNEMINEHIEKLIRDNSLYK